MRRNADDDENPFDGVFGTLNEMLAGMTGDEADSVDVHEYDDELRVVADVPDASREDIDVQCNGRVLAIRVAREPHPFLNRVDLPAYVDDQPARVRVNNGILEVTLDRETDPASIGFY